MTQVRVRFVTDYDIYRVTDTPFAIPITLSSSGLNDVVNHLLGNDENDDNNVNFDFTINNVFIKDKLSKFLKSYNISLESAVTIKYFPTININNDKKINIDTNAWVGSLDFNDNFLLTGCYDGNCQLFNIKKDKGKGDIQTIHNFTPHDVPIRAVKFLNNNNNNDNDYVCTGSKDHTVKISNINTNQVIATGTEHYNSVESLCTFHYNDDYLLFSGDWAGNVVCWNISNDLLIDVQQNNKHSSSSSKSRKRNRNNNDSSTTTATSSSLKKTFSMNCHTQCISKLFTLNQNSLVTVSHDHFLKLWDIERQDNTSTIPCKKVITDADYNKITNSILSTSHTDGVIRLWDLRLNNETFSLSTLQNSSNSSSNSSWVSGVSWHPNDANKLASCDYDGMIKLWDIRSTNETIDTINAHAGSKALCIHTMNDAIISGGADCQVVISPFM